MANALRPSADDALAEWARRVRADREQVERFREEPERPDFYAPVAAVFKADPRRTDDPILDALLSLVRPGETWLDIGAGGGRFALPLALAGAKVIALDASARMLEVLREAMTEFAVDGVQVVQSRWPAPEPPACDVALIANVGNDVEEIGPFLDAMEGAARRLCAAIVMARPPASYAARFWPAIHGEEREVLPALPELLALLLARGRLFEVRLVPRKPFMFASPEEALPMLRQQLWLRPGSEKDLALQAMLPGEIKARDGVYSLSWDPMPSAIVTWAPR